VRALILPVLLIVMAATPGRAAAARAVAEGDFVAVCTAALLNPGALPSVLAERGLAAAVERTLRPTVEVTVYASADGERTVTLNRERYSDFTAANCVVAGDFPSSITEIETLRGQLERSGKARIEGEILEPAGALRVAHFKRMGNDPVILINVSATSNTTVYTMIRWDLQPGQ
jgi:hypothetical protein